MKQGKHLNKEGLKKILALKASFNLGLFDQLNEALSDIVLVLRPNLKDSLLILDLNWFAGFTDAEGCFLVSIRESINSRLGEAVSLRFILI